MILSILLAAVATSTSSPSLVQALNAPVRPRDPFVFRSVLDKKPRIVTIALSDEMWAAWDATECRLYKAWRGGVLFDGPVYTTVHGPQPSSRGPSYTEGLEGAVWGARVDGKPVAVTARWGGYRIDQGHAVLMYAIDVADKGTVAVEEAPEFVRPENLFSPDRREELALEEGWPGLLRQYTASKCPEHVKLTLFARTDADASRLVDPRDTERETFVDVKDAKGIVVATQIHSYIVLTAEKPHATVIQFFHPLPEPPKDSAAQGGK